MIVKQVIGNRILVLPEVISEKTKAGLVLAEKARPVPRKGKVIQLGQIEGDIKGHVKVGDIVHFSRYEGFDIVRDGKEYRMLDAKFIYAKEI